MQKSRTRRCEHEGVVCSTGEIQDERSGRGGNRAGRGEANRW